MRIRSKFHRRSRPKSLQEVAGAYAFNVWRIASTTVNRMHSDGFNFSSNQQILSTITEFVAFAIQLTDRLVYERMDESQRPQFISTMAAKLIHTLVDNMREELGESEYEQGIIKHLNSRFEEYADFAFIDCEPSYKALRYFGSNVNEILGKENKWIIEQIVDVESPLLIKTLKKNLDDLLEQSEVATKADKTPDSGKQ